MLKYKTCRNPTLGQEWVETDLTGKALLATPLLNKGTAFTEEERHTLKLLGKLPYRVETLEEQVVRAKHQYDGYQTILQKYIYLNNLHDKNEILYYKLLSEYLPEMVPLVYTPGVGMAVKKFSVQWRQPRGLYIAYPDRNHVKEILDNRTHVDIDLLVVTDGERILGIGDQGIGGMDIPIAKLVVYSICGVNPYRSIPIMLDVGTDNEELLNDPLYLGWRHPRIKGQAYDDFVAQFVQAVHERFPHSFLHWEDFAQQNARRVLERYRTYHCSFNDDMQGTAVVTLAALLAAVAVNGTALSKQRIVLFGAGTAGVGIVDLLVRAMVKEGIPASQARSQFWLIDREGLLLSSDALKDFQVPYARQEVAAWPSNKRDLLSIVETIAPTILIGTSAVAGAFREEVIRAMRARVENPIIFPLSNPNEYCEATPEAIVHWTEGSALMATGSPFEAVYWQGKHYPVAQCNNALAFPGIGMGILATKATHLTEGMLHVAAEALAEQSPALRFKDKTKALLPAIAEMREVACYVAMRVARQAIEEGVATVYPDLSLEIFEQENIWKPYYRPIRLVQ